MSKKIYLIAGEASGDLHGSNLMKELLVEDAQLEFRFWGGDKMNEVSKGLVKHIRDLAFMGFLEVLLNIRTILKNMKFCKKDIIDFQPDTIVLIDYPGFNLRIAEWAKSQGIHVVYYISPQIWAWKQKRVHTIKRVVDKMYVILPFEEEFYHRFGMNVDYVGHPLLDEIDNYAFNEQQRRSFYEKYALDDRPIIAVLPGSRKQEVTIKLPIMLEALSVFQDHQVVIAGAPNLTTLFYESIAGNAAKVIENETYHLLMCSKTAVVASGTATLETALFKVPEVVCYKGSMLSYIIAKRLVKVKFISLVNLIMGHQVVRELIQDECTPEKIREEMTNLLYDQGAIDKMMEEYARLESMLGGGGASKKVAQSLLSIID